MKTVSIINKRIEDTRTTETEKNIKLDENKEEAYKRALNRLYNENSYMDLIATAELLEKIIPYKDAETKAAAFRKKAKEISDKALREFKALHHIK